MAREYTQGHVDEGIPGATYLVDGRGHKKNRFGEFVLIVVFSGDVFVSRSLITVKMYKRISY